MRSMPAHEYRDVHAFDDALQAAANAHERSGDGPF
jgi:hypothetical protein